MAEPDTAEAAKSVSAELDAVLAGLSPLPLQSIVKELKAIGFGKKRPKDEFEAEVQEALDEAVAAGRVFRARSGGKGLVDRFWAKDERALLVEAAVAAAAEPVKIKDLVKTLTAAESSPSKEFASALVHELIESGQLHKRADTHKDAVGQEPAPAVKSLAERIHEALAERLETLTEPTKKADLFKGLKGRGDPKPAFDTTANEVLAALLGNKTLHEHAVGKAKLYHTKPPAERPWYETKEYQKPFAALLKAVKKVMDVGGTTSDSILTALRKQFGLEADTATLEPAKAEHQTPATVEPKPSADKAAGMDLRTALHKAYDELCLLVEFRDKLVELRRLYPETRKLVPDLSVETFHRELLGLERERKVELHGLNEVHSAKDRNLAIERDGRLLYFVIWR